jgi:hypothetical protein
MKMTTLEMIYFPRCYFILVRGIGRVSFDGEWCNGFN